MRLIWITVSLILLIGVSCNKDAHTTENVSRLLEKGSENDTSTEFDATLELSKLQEADSESDRQILPPLILLDFADDSDNTTSSEEKIKRGIDNGLGYGYLRNNLFNGKTNFYFPGGKSGTTVSIEESISPFEPKTIIEPYKPITERPDESSNNYQPISQNHGSQNSRPNSENNNANYRLTNQAVFGQRTKLQKASPTGYSFQTFSTTPKPNVITYTTVRPQHQDYSNANHNNINAYTTTQPNYQNPYTPRQSYTTVRPNYESYSTTTPASYDSRYTIANIHQHRPTYETPTTPRTLSVDPTVFNLPRYTVENGVKYENKIIWKYPDGRIANAPAATYTNSYPDYVNQQKVNTYNNNYQNVAYQNPINHQSSQYSEEINQGNQNVPYQNQQPTYQALQGIRYPQDSANNIYSQRPAQFPTDQEPSQPARQSQFVSSASISSSQAQGYDFSYQNKYGLRQRGNTNGATRYEQRERPTKYSIDSANPEYTYSTESPIRDTTSSNNLFTTSGQLSPDVLSKYTPQAQKYLAKVFANNPGMTREQLNAHLAQYTNTNYENLLNYNPSISQYIRDPSSILNAQPTFIQAGKSLIPVIILRVDGAAPIQQKPTPNINLKALLQQYLTEYAGSKAALSQNSNYEYATGITEKPIAQSALNELTQLTQVLSRFSPNYEHNASATQKLSQHPLDYTPRPSYSQSSYDTVNEGVGKVPVDNSRIKFGMRTNIKPQKIKSVEIIEDPRFPNYKKTN